MKKISSSFLAVLLLVTAFLPVAHAQDALNIMADPSALQSVVLTPVSPSQALENVNTWLYEEDGIDALNGMLHEYYVLAQEEITDGAGFAGFYFAYFSANHIATTFTFQSLHGSTDDNLYVRDTYTVRGTPGESETYETNTAQMMSHPQQYFIYRVDMRMRDLVPALLADDDVMSLLDDLFAQESTVGVAFDLAKNDHNELWWTVHFYDVITGEHYKVRTRADQGSESLEAPHFTVYSVQ